MERPCMCVGVLLFACAPELERGSHTAQLSGTQVLVDGSESPYTESMDVTVVLQSVRGPDTYTMTFCEGFVSYISSAPCLGEAYVVEGAEGLTSHDEHYFYDYENGCSGVETLYVTGEIQSETEATSRWRTSSPWTTATRWRRASETAPIASRLPGPSPFYPRGRRRRPRP